MIANPALALRSASATARVYAAGIALVVVGGAADLALHFTTDVLGLADPRLLAAEYAGHVVIFVGMAVAIGGVIGQARRFSRYSAAKHATRKRKE